MVSKMPDEEAGKLFKLIFEYTNDMNPDESKYGILVEVAFAQIKNILKKDLEKWKGTVNKNSENGKKSAEARRKNKETTVNETERPLTTVNQPSTNSTDKDKVNVYTSYIERLCSAFGVTQMNNARSFISATNFIEAIAVDGRLEYFSSQLTGFTSIREPKYRGSISKFIGTPEDNYQNGGWCAETYSVEVVQNQKPTGTASIILGKEPIKC